MAIPVGIYVQKTLPLPALFDEEALARARAIYDRLPEIEEQLSAWEDANPAAYKAMPWFTTREEFKRLKAAGAAPTPTFFEVALLMGVKIKGLCDHGLWLERRVAWSKKGNKLNQANRKLAAGQGVK